jgi:hypothetical protein
MFDHITLRIPDLGYNVSNSGNGERELRESRRR